jgi:tetratricopeptide (TPR) repeat protein
MVSSLVVASLSIVLAATADVNALLRSTPADSLGPPLRELEARRERPAEAVDAALTLGRLHLARGEYRDAVAAFARAAARLDPTRKPEARYWAGVAWLGLGEASQARAALEEVVRAGGSRRAAAQLGVAQAWELAKQHERAFETLGDLLRGDPGEAGPAALDRYAALADRLGRPDDARRARERLVADYPRSIEAAAARPALVLPGREGGGFSVVIGTFIDPGRARSLASEARRSGFSRAEVVTQGKGLAAVHSVRLGLYPSREAARQAGEQAARALGVAYQTAKAP